MSKIDDWLEAMGRRLDRADDRNAIRLDEFLRRAADLPSKTIQPGDRVIVAAGFLGRGPEWQRTECIVIEAASDSSLVQSVHDLTEWKQWVHNALIVDVLPPKTEEK
jgi:hypothetical protein